MRIIKIKWGFYSIIDKAGKEVAVAGSWSEANRTVKKRHTNRTNITK